MRYITYILMILTVTASLLNTALFPKTAWAADKDDDSCTSVESPAIAAAIIMGYYTYQLLSIGAGAAAAGSGAGGAAGGAGGAAGGGAVAAGIALAILAYEGITLAVDSLVSEGLEFEDKNNDESSRRGDVDGKGCNGWKNKDLFKKEITFCYNPWRLDGTLRYDTSGGTRRNCGNIRGPNYSNLQTMAKGSTRTIHDMRFTVRSFADKLCLYYYRPAFSTLIITGGSGWVPIGCKSVPAPPVTPPAPRCYVGKSCMDETLRTSKNYISITGPVVQCLSETVNGFFYNTNNCSTLPNLFLTFQNAMKKAVTAALTLYVMFFGIKVVLGEETPSKGEVLIFVLKMALVIYFVLSDGLTTYLFPAFKGTSTYLAYLMFSATSANGLCYYDPATYIGDSTMALWDSLDCRLAYYVGLNHYPKASDPGLLKVVFALLPVIFFYIMLVLFMLVFFVFLLSLAVHAVHIYVLSLIFLTFFLYISPLFIPFVLFKHTRSYFDSWLKMVFCFILQPAVLFAFLALVLTIFDSIVYPKCEFGHEKEGKYTIYTIKTSNLNLVDKEICERGFGNLVYALSNGDNMKDVDLGFVKTRMPTAATVLTLTYAMLKLVLFGFIAVHFMDILTTLAAELTGGQSMIGIGISPLAVASEAWRAAKSKTEKKPEQG